MSKRKPRSGSRTLKAQVSQHTNGQPSPKRKRRVVVAGVPWEDLRESYGTPQLSKGSRAAIWVVGVVISAVVSTLLALAMAALLDGADQGSQ